MFWGIIFGIAVLSTILYILQGGFGAGQGKFDFFLGVLALPWSLISWPEYFYKRDYVWLILLPLFLNSMCISLIYYIIVKIKR